ncbi:hypothetical protein E2F43_13510 [Seongchinamella unica]|uniref:Uncharacterized protein n=1 Tax=Seongchinamella unica TaxID=2547392 RepID=A0A4R5LPW6_9GAMM|nr:hypothetical protein [Seongchinamella unica]TDG12604.1 hypothetical protein E2F43_13510 [Seongchinamella unica]
MITQKEFIDEVVALGAETIKAGETLSFDKSAIHSVHNLLDTFTGAIHVYGGDFLDTDRSEWDPETLSEQPRDPSRMKFSDGLEPSAT